MLLVVFTNIVDGSELLLMVFTSSVLSSKCLFSKKTWLPDIDWSLDNQCGGIWAELSSDFGWSAGQPDRGPFWAVVVGGFSLVSRATRLGATMGDLGRRISAGQWGNQGDPSSGCPRLPSLLPPCAPQAGPQGALESPLVSQGNHPSSTCQPSSTSLVASF